MIISAHFTLRDLPATVAILLIGVSLGAWWMTIGLRIRDLPLIVLAGIISIMLIVSFLADHDRSIGRLGVGGVPWDLALFTVAVLLLLRIDRLAERRVLTRRR